MSTNAAPAAPFSSSVLTEDVELHAVAQALRFSEGFKLIFIRCNQLAQRRRIAEALRVQLAGGFEVQEIDFGGEDKLCDLLDELYRKIRTPAPDALFISGLEHLLPSAAHAPSAPLLANLNAARSSFPLLIPCPLVLWVSEYVLSVISQFAPDFFAIRSGVYSFAASPQDTAVTSQELTIGSEWQAISLPVEEKIERIESIQRLLDDYMALPWEQRDKQVEMRLLNRLGSLFFSLARWAEAKKSYGRSLVIAQELEDRDQVGSILNNLGNVHLSQGQLNDAERCFKESLEIKRESGDLGGLGISLNNLGAVYKRQGKWSDAAACYEQDLQICEQLSNSAGKAPTFNNLGNVYLALGQLQEAENYYLQSLHVARAYFNLSVAATALDNLGATYRLQGRLSEAEKCFQEGLRIAREIGDPTTEGRVLKNLALLRALQLDMSEAVELGTQAINILEQTEDVQGLTEARDATTNATARLIGSGADGQPS